MYLPTALLPNNFSLFSKEIPIYYTQASSLALDVPAANTLMLIESTMTTANTSDNNLFLIFFISFFLSGLFQTFGLWQMILHLQSLVTFRYNSCAPLPYLYPHRKDISPACFHMKYIPLAPPSQASCTQYRFATPMPTATNIWEKKAGKTPIPSHLWYLSFACMSLSVFDVMHLRPKLADCTAAFSDCMGITPIRNGLR